MFPGELILQVWSVGPIGVAAALQRLARVALQLVGMTQVLAARQVVAVGAEFSNENGVVIQAVSEGVNCELCSTNGLCWSWWHRA